MSSKSKAADPIYISGLQGPTAGGISQVQGADTHQNPHGSLCNESQGTLPFFYGARYFHRSIPYGFVRCHPDPGVTEYLCTYLHSLHILIKYLNHNIFRFQVMNHITRPSFTQINIIIFIYPGLDPCFGLPGPGLCIAVFSIDFL